MSLEAQARHLSDVELAAHLAEVAGALLIAVRVSGVLNKASLGKAGDATANEFLVRALVDGRFPSNAGSI